MNLVVQWLSAMAEIFGWVSREVTKEWKSGTSQLLKLFFLLVIP